MNATEFFKLLVGEEANPFSVTAAIKEITQGYDPELVNACLLTLPDMLRQWKSQLANGACICDPWLLLFGFPGDRQYLPTWFDGITLPTPPMYDYAIEQLTKYATSQAEPPRAAELPPELDTPQARAIFAELVKEGYCEKVVFGYRWRKSLALLAFFIDEVSKDGNLDLRPSSGRIPWALFQPVFNLSKNDIESCRREVSRYKQNYKNKPQDWRLLEAIIRSV